MTEKAFTFAYWFDVGAKMLIASALGVATWHLKTTGDRVEGLENRDGKRQTEIAVLQTVNLTTAKQLDRIESKIEKIWEMAREVHK